MHNLTQVRQILERHLLVGHEFSIANLTEQGRDNYLQTIRGKVKITIVESGGGKMKIWNLGAITTDELLLRIRFFCKTKQKCSFCIDYVLLIAN